MVKLARRAALVAFVLATAVLSAGPALAAAPTDTSTPSSSETATSHTGYACLDEAAGYAPTGACQLVVTADPVCRDNVPWLDYSVKPEGTPNTTTTIVWGDENGTHYTMPDLPLTGSVRWPGTEVDAQGNPTDWPGWSLVNGDWVEHDQWDWVRPSVPLTFHVNPSATVTVSYPDSVAPCGPKQAVTAVLAADDVATTPTSSAVLAATGSSDATPLLLTAAGLLLVGSLALGVRATVRRRSSAR